MGIYLKSNANKVIRILKTRVIELSSLLIALCALFLTVHQINSTNYHNRLSVLPLLQISYENDNDFTRVIIENVGTGPAIITDLEIGGRKANSIESVVAQFQKLNKLNFTTLKAKYVKIAERIVIQAGTYLTMVELNKNKLEEEKQNELILTDFLKGIPLTACYRSVYGDRFYSTNNQKLVKESSCAYKDAYKVGKKWFRYQPYSEINQSEIYGY